MIARYFKFCLCKHLLLSFCICIWNKIFFCFVWPGWHVFSKESFVWMISTVWDLGTRKVNDLLRAGGRLGEQRGSSSSWCIIVSLHESLQTHGITCPRLISIRAPILHFLAISTSFITSFNFFSICNDLSKLEFPQLQHKNWFFCTSCVPTLRVKTAVVSWA